MKKIACITHSFHQKTKSAHLYPEEIFGKTDYSIDYYYVDDWSLHSVGLHEPIIGYDIVIIVQLISLEILNKIQCDHIVFIPMYDFSCTWDAFKWFECTQINILSPTKKIHDIACQMGLNSHYIQYYPAPAEYLPGDLKKVFLWQRINDININTVLQLLNPFPIDQIYLHHVPDPGHIAIEPSHEDILKYNITISTWFENKNDYLDILDGAGIYMAPRLKEGGGSAFIDAMKKGKVVIAHNDGAMNDYITHNETGLLYDAHNPQALNVEPQDFVRIQQNAYQSVLDGRVRWQKSIPQIIDFMYQKRPSISDQSLLAARNYREMLRQEHDVLKQKLEHAEHILQHDRWYNFGQLSHIEKMKKLFRILT
ncbi:MAG: glycosyltransferase [Legionellaceae bacterium]|nr:glycosyltransferase [Legionellaceae bacterium]